MVRVNYKTNPTQLVNGSTYQYSGHKIICPSKIAICPRSNFGYAGHNVQRNVDCYFRPSNTLTESDLDWRFAASALRSNVFLLEEVDGCLSEERLS